MIRTPLQKFEAVKNFGTRTRTIFPCHYGVAPSANDGHVPAILPRSASNLSKTPRANALAMWGRCRFGFVSRARWSHDSPGPQKTAPASAEETFCLPVGFQSPSNTQQSR
jgi:hypothetical protein